MEMIFWKDGNYEAEGGIYIRNDLFKFFDKLKEQGYNPVGIKIDGTWNLEVIVEKKLNSEQNPERSVATGLNSSNEDD